MRRRALRDSSLSGDIDSFVSLVRSGDLPLVGRSNLCSECGLAADLYQASFRGADVLVCSTVGCEALFRKRRMRVR